MSKLGPEDDDVEALVETNDEDVSAVVDEPLDGVKSIDGFDKTCEEYWEGWVGKAGDVFLFEIENFLTLGNEFKIGFFSWLYSFVDFNGVFLLIFFWFFEFIWDKEPFWL